VHLFRVAAHFRRPGKEAVANHSSRNVWGDRRDLPTAWRGRETAVQYDQMQSLHHRWQQRASPQARAHERRPGRLAKESTRTLSQSSINMYNNDVGKRFMKQKGTLTSATIYFTS
jgi:hypothetical protein